MMLVTTFSEGLAGEFLVGAIRSFAALDLKSLADAAIFCVKYLRKFKKKYCRSGLLWLGTCSPAMKMETTLMVKHGEDLQDCKLIWVLENF